MAAQASWARKLPAVNDNASFEIAYVMSAQLALERGELYGSGSSRIIGTCTTESMRILVSFLFRLGRAEAGSSDIARHRGQVAD